MAVSKLEDIQDRSATLIQHAIREQKVLDLDIKVEASRMILPQLGKLNLLVMMSKIDRFQFENLL
jgi:Repeating coiled region of VPS13